MRPQATGEDVALSAVILGCCLRSGDVDLASWLWAGAPVGSEGVENNGRNWHLRRGGALVLCGICSGTGRKNWLRKSRFLRREAG